MTMASTFINTTIDTPRLTLRPLTPKDANALYNIMSDVEVMRYWKTDSWKSMEQAYNAIDEATKGMNSGNKITFGLIRKSDHALIGTCMLFNIIKNCKRAEIGYGLTASAWGKGYMREAFYEFLSFAFDRLNLNRIEAEIDPRNASSAKILKRLGFHKDGYLKQRWIIHGDIADSELYGLLEEEWQIRKKQNKY